jgi:hypothetical protein
MTGSVSTERVLYPRRLGIGAALKIVGVALSLASESDFGRISGIGLQTAGAIWFLLGCVGYARSKGWHVAVGLLGLFSFIGLLTLWQLPTMQAPRRRRE